jgi:hypothetical protein
MAARVIHFGWDDCCRVPVLRTAGFDIWEANSLDELSVILQRNERLDAVVISENTEQSAEQAADMTRRFSPAPRILFRRSQLAIDEARFDKIYSCLTPPDIWLRETVTLVAKGDKLKVDCIRVDERAPGAVSEVDGRTIAQGGWRL